MASSSVRAEVRVSGRVQGVGFRYFVMQAAQAWGLKGMTRNESDGSVFTIAEGSSSNVSRLVELIEQGSEFSRVENCRVEWKESSGEYEEFRIQR